MQGSNDAPNQVALERTIRNDGAEVICIWADFPLAHVPRAFLQVPLSRENGIATFMSPQGQQTIPEKLLDLNFLSLRQRVEFRKRVALFYNPNQLSSVLFFPTWDFNGPDLHYFGKWKPASFDPTSSILAGPWRIDGRELVADAKDRMMQCVEAALWIQALRKCRITIKVADAVPNDLVLSRGWPMGKGAWSAWWAGVRKAAEVVEAFGMNIQFVACSAINPYDGMIRHNPVQYKLLESFSLNEDEFTLRCAPMDPFENIAHRNQALLAEALGTKASTISFSNVFVALPSIFLPSTLPGKCRNFEWDPLRNLDAIDRMTRTKQKK